MNPGTSAGAGVLNSLEKLSIDRRCTLREALRRLDESACGILLLLNGGGQFERTVTDGDIRRLLLEGAGLDSTLVSLGQIESIILLDGSYTRRFALSLMGQHSINHIPVLDAQGSVVRLLDRQELDDQILLSTPHLGDFELEFVNDAFRTNWIAPLGPNVDGFERELAKHVGSSYAAAVSSGTAAIHLALRMLNVGAGDFVFCSSLTFVASANPIVYQGAQPVFIDSEPESWNMSAVALEKAFDWAKRAGKMPKAVIVVNLYGQSADMDPILALCEHHGVPVVEDAAESLGAKYKGRASGTFGLMGIFSFNGNKIITTSGGGMLISEDETLIKQARFLATQARDPAAHYEHTQIGFNYRMSNILAGVGRGQLRVLEERVKARRSVFDSYRKGLGHVEELEWMPEPEWSYSTHWLTVCTLNNKNQKMSSRDLIHKLAAEQIEARPVWKPMHLQPVFRDCPSFDHADESVSACIFENGICFPSGSNMTKEQQERVIHTTERLMSGAPVN